ncbi:unnamed protein product [Paramecium pentaurelia]|uniref:Uncharacterized protein n=1 Tax=Paramecium pentaurelia TaxID=43138 RepID=A0A8S1X8M7_9CILI|nr:unnamed protein product [Paramecium pentaurelia]
MINMDIENSAQTAFFASDPKDMVEKLENIEIASENFDSQMACLQYFSYILTWDIVNARFFYYKYMVLLESEIIGKEITKFLKLVYEEKHSELIKECDKLCELLNIFPPYKKWIKELKSRVADHLKNLVEKNFTSISAARLSSYGGNPQEQSYVKIEQKEQEKTPIDIEKLSQIARLIQNMENK